VYIRLAIVVTLAGLIILVSTKIYLQICDETISPFCSQSSLKICFLLPFVSVFPRHFLFPFSSPDSASHLPRIWRKRKATHVRRCHSTHATGEANPSHLHLAPTTQPTTYSTTSPTTDAAACTHRWCCRCHPALKVLSSRLLISGPPDFGDASNMEMGKPLTSGEVTPHHSPAAAATVTVTRSRAPHRAAK
jgi:hypothetical protein